MPKIIGNTTATPNPRPDWAQTDSTKADFIKNKPALGDLAAKNTVDKTDLAADVQASLGKADTAIQSVDNKVDKVDGKGLSTEDYTTAEKNKLAGIAAGAEVNVQSDWAQTNTGADDYIKNKPTLGSLAAKSTVIKTDLDSAVQASLNKADTALQSETDPTVPAWAKESTKPAYNLGEISDTANRCAIHIVHATSEDGITYTGTIDGVTELTAGLTIMFIANVASTTSGSFLDINGFGRKSIMRYVAFTANSEFRNLVSVPKIFTKTPILLTYDAVGSWVAHGLTVPVSSDLDGLVPIYKGGTNASTTAEARTNLGVPSVTEMNTALNSALGYGYPFYYADGYLVQGQALSNKSYTLTVMYDVEESYIITVSNKAILSTNALIGRWVLIDGKRAYVGANTLNQLVLYTDSTLTTQFNITCTAGTIIYPADGTFTDLTAVEEKIQNDISSAISKIPTPDVSGQINAHNTSEESHSDIRNAISQKTQVQFITWEAND